MPHAATPSVPLTPQRPSNDTGSQRAVRGQPQVSRFGPACHDVATLYVEGRPIAVSVRIAHDGIEYVGRLWFSEEEWDDDGFPDRGALPGRTRDEVLQRARQLTDDELSMRHRRALAEKRKFIQLRHVTEEILAKIRYMNQIAISMRAGLLDTEGAHQELEVTERQLHDCINRLRYNAGIED